MAPPRQLITGVVAGQLCGGMILGIFLIAQEIDVTVVASLCVLLAGLCGLRALRQDGPDRSALLANLLAAFLLTTILTNSLVTMFGNGGSTSRFGAGMDFALFAPMLALCVAAVYMSYAQRGGGGVYGLLGLLYVVTGVLFLACYALLGLFLTNWLALLLTACLWFFGILALPTAKPATTVAGT